MKGEVVSVTTAKSQEKRLPAVVDTDGDEESLPSLWHLRQEALELREELDRVQWKLAEKLYEIRQAQAYLAWGFDSFAEYIETDMGFSVRKAQQHISIYQTLGLELGVDKSEVEDVGWTKAREIVRVARTHDEAIDWANRARDLSQSDLQSKVRSAVKARESNPTEDTTSDEDPVDEDKEVPTLQHRSFTLYPDQAATLDRALELASEIAESDKEGYLLDVIAQSFLQSHGMDSSKEDLIDRWIHAVERQFDVKVLVMHRGGGDAYIESLKRAKKEIEAQLGSVGELE